MIDLHCHILPFVDDGAQSMTEAVEMAKIAWESGTNILVATPHCCRRVGWSGFFAEEIKSRIFLFRQALEECDIPIRIYAGMEVFATLELPALYHDGKLLTIANSRYLLLEFFFNENPEQMNLAIGAVRMLGLTPVIAHPERYDAVQRDPALAARWFQEGSLLQLNKGSVLGSMGVRAQETAWWLLNRGIAHVVASDAHSTRGRNPALQEVSRVLKERLDHAYARILLHDNPRRIVLDRNVISVD